MAISLQESFDRCCRLCAKEQDVTVMIFSKEAEAMLLQNKLNKYLLIEVDEDDRLPKNICLLCCSKLQTVCEFIDTARNAQDLLLNRSLELDGIAQGNLLVPIKHEVQSDSEDNNDDDDESKHTQMEVSVDPMMVLQNSEETASNHNEDSTIYMEDVTYMHAVDADNVTIKLIKKSEKPEIATKPNASEEEDKSESLKPYPCITCKRGFYSELALKNHTWMHITENHSNTTDNKYTCATCLANFYYKNDLVTHLKTHQNNGLCQLCGRMFRSEKNYVAHMSVHLPSNKAYTCKICGRSYNTWGSLRTHSVTHSSDRPYTCQYCKKTFKRNQDLKFHTNQHTGAKPYKCPFCDKSFASSGNCYSHRSRMHPGKHIDGKIRRWNAQARASSPQPIKTKTARAVVPKNPLTVVKGIYKYKCHMCGASFVRKDNFTYHMFQHTGEKPFQCAFCPEKFVTRKGQLLHHDKEHPNQNRPLALLSKNILLK